MKGRAHGPGGKSVGTLFFKKSVSNTKTHRKIKILLLSNHSKPKKWYIVSIFLLLHYLHYHGGTKVRGIIGPLYYLTFKIHAQKTQGNLFGAVCVVQEWSTRWVGRVRGGRIKLLNVGMR